MRFTVDTSGLPYLIAKSLLSMILFESHWRHTDTSALRSCLHESSAFRERTARQVTLRRKVHITRLQESLGNVQYGSQRSARRCV